MKKQFAFVAAVAALVCANSYAQDTLTGGLQVDSINVSQKMTVQGETLMREDATASRDLTVEGDLFAKNRIYYPNAPAFSGALSSKQIVLFDQSTGLLEKSTLGAIQLELWKWQCMPVNGVASVGWSVLPNVIGYDCPTVNTGVGTLNPLARLHVAGDERVDGFARIADRLSVGADPSGFSRVYIKTGTYGAGLEINGNGNTGQYPKLLFMTFSNDQTELIKATNTVANYNPFIVTGKGAMYLNNGTSAIFSLASDGQLIMRNGSTGDKTFQFDINGLFRARRVRVDAAQWADFVFEPGYELMPLEEVNTFIKANKHLPAVPSEKTVSEQGIDLAEMNKILLQKVEELTLYLLGEHEDNKALLKEIEDLKQRIAVLESAGK